MTKRVATFECLHDRREMHKYIPAYTVFYGKPARIFLVREQGELKIEVNTATSDAPDDENSAHQPTQPTTSTHDTDNISTAASDDTILCNIRSCTGGAQGCVLSTNGCLLPYHQCLRRLNKKYKKLRITCQADDTYLGGHHSFIYDAFDETRIDQREACTLESNVKKLKAFSVNHGVTNVPQYIRDAQGGYIVGFKCVSAFVGPDTAEGTAWKIDMLTKTFEKKLIYLDALDALPKHLSDKDAPGLKHYQYNYLSRCANTMPTYFQRLMPPSVTSPAISAAITPRLRRSMELLAEAHATPEDERDEWWERCQLDVNMGGQGIGGHETRSAPAFCAQVAQSWPRLRAASPALAHLDGVTHSIPMLDEFMEHYTDLATECGEIAHEHKRLHDAFFYTTVRGGKEHYFNPKSLPPASKLPSAARLLQVNDKSSKFLPPAQRKLTFIVKHRRFLAARDTAQKRDQSHPHPTTRFRTETLLISNAQPAAGAPFEIAPDGTPGTTMDDLTFLHYLQRQGGLDISRAKSCNDVLEATGHVVDRKGDNLTQFQHVK